MAPSIVSSKMMITPHPGERLASPRPLSIVLDHRRRHLGRRLWRRISGITGAVLLMVGLVASIPAIPANLAVVSFVMGWVESSASDPWPADDVPVREILLAWAILTPAAVGGLSIGLRLLRRHRTLILFLRRFGHDDAQKAVTFAVLRTIGSSWRVVTLDDAELPPIGVTAGTRRLFRFGHLTSKHVLAIGQFIGMRMFPILIWATLTVVALGLIGPAWDFARTGTTSPERWADAIEPYLTILGSMFERQPPLDAVGPTLPGLFALLVMAAAVSFLALLATMVALALAVPLSPVLVFLSSSADAVREAERSKTLTASSMNEVSQAAQAIARRSRKVLGPRLVVLKVASPVWRHAVTELASLSSLTLVDISEPTENVVWEIDELSRRRGHNCVLIGEYDRVAVLAGLSASDSEPTSSERLLAQMLAGREVLAYTTDPKGLKRFAKALRCLLLTKTRTRSPDEAPGIG